MEYSCCNFPVGYQGYNSNCNGPGGRYDSFCVGCTDLGESLQYNSTTQTYSYGPSLEQQLCNAGNFLISATQTLGLFSTWAGSICPTTDPKSIFLTLLQDADSIMSAIATPTNGILGTRFRAASAVVTCISTSLLRAAVIIGAPAEAPAAEGIAVVCETARIINTAAGAMLFISQSLTQSVIDDECTPATSKRSISPGADGEALGFSNELYPRDNTYNPCLEFVNIFPSNYSIPAAANTACDQIQVFNTSATGDETIAYATTTLQQFCTGYQESGNSTFMMNFANLLSALHAAVPYCNSTSSSSTIASLYISSSTTSWKEGSTAILLFPNGSFTSTVSTKELISVLSFSSSPTSTNSIHTLTSRTSIKPSLISSISSSHASSRQTSTSSVTNSHSISSNLSRSHISFASTKSNALSPKPSSKSTLSSIPPSKKSSTSSTSPHRGSNATSKSKTFPITTAKSLASSRGSQTILKSALTSSSQTTATKSSSTISKSSKPTSSSSQSTNKISS